MARTRREVLTFISSLITSAVIANPVIPFKTKKVSNNKKLPDGVLTAVLTPMDSNLNADHTALSRHIKWLLQRGNNGIALLGTTGEANSFSVEERLRILEAVLEDGIDPGKLLLGTGCCAITDTVTLTRHAHEHGVNNILLLPPFYYKQINDAGLEKYFSILLDKVGAQSIQIYLYHFPKLTGVNFSHKLIEKFISRYPDNIVGMKDSGGDWSHMEEILKAFPGYQLYAGSEKYLLPVLNAGGAGCISASANLTSPEAAIVYNAWKKGSGEPEQARLSELREALEQYPAIGTLKYVFAKLSGNQDWLNIRPPNAILTKEEGLHIEEKLKQLDYFTRF